MTETINKILKGDRTIIIAVAVLMLISALLMGSTSPSLAIQKHNFSFEYLFKQLFLSGFAFLIMIFVSRIPYQAYFKISKPILIASLVLLAITVVSGKSINDTRRWFMIPYLNVTVQTSDIVRFALIMHIAKIISEYNANKDNLKDMVKRVLYWSLPVILAILFINVSTGLLLIVIVFTILFFTPINLKYFIRIGAFVLVAGVAVLLFQEQFNVGRGGTISSRVLGSDRFQKEQALIAVANAKIIPHPGSSKQKYLLSNSQSDFVFSIAVEEYGIIGIFLIIGMYLIILYRIGIIVRQQKRSFPMFLVLGLSMNILLQAFLHLFVSVGLGPVTGQPLPLISMGGTSTIITATQIGIILNISSIKEKQEIPVILNDDEENEDINDSEDDTNNEQEEIEINDYPFLVG